MSSLQGLKTILKKALELERFAEVNCEKILHEARINGFHDAIKHIEKDEVQHQEMVKRLQSYL